MHRPAFLLPCIALVALSAAPRGPLPRGALAAEEGAGTLEAFRRQFRREDPEARAAAFRLVDVTTSEALPALHDGFRDGHFLVRGAAAEAAARIEDGPLRAQLRVDLLTHKEEAVRGGLAYALALAPVRGDGEALASALEDRAPSVRRDAARGLRALPSRGAVEALLGALAREQDARPRVWILDALRAIARADIGDGIEEWNAWWKANRDRAAFQPPEDVRPDRREFAGIPLEVVTVGGRRGGADGDAEGRRRPELFVLAPFGWSHAWYRPHLDALERTFTVHYIRLPSLQELTGLSGYGQGIGTYPVGRLARAFEALRAERGVESVTLLAEGATCWVAEAYAVLQPKRTRGLILLDGWLDADGYVAALRRLAAAGNEDEVWMAKSLLGEGPADRDRREDHRMGLVSLAHRLVDRADLLGHLLWTTARDPQGFASVPALRFDRRSRIETPTLFLFPAASPLSGHPDARRIRDAFPQGLVATMEDTRGLPFVDRHDEFHRIVRGFVDRFRLDRP